jgi:CheY-like chemotaxis protein
VQSTLTLVDAIAREALEIGRTASDDDALRSQAALVRALVDELQHYHPSDRRVAALHAQLGDELGRLAQIVFDRPTAERAGSRTEPLDVLVVEDEESTRHATLSVVRGLGYSCRAAANAQEALAEYERQPAAIVISDWSMPGYSGLELCRLLKKRDPHAYVILVTAFSDRARVLEGACGGVDDFLPKPIDVDELNTRLRAAEPLVRAIRVLVAARGKLKRGAARWPTVERKA